MLDGKGNATYKADCWSLGIIIYELVSLKLPFTEKNERELEKLIRQGIFEPIDGPEDLIIEIFSDLNNIFENKKRKILIPNSKLEKL